MYNIGDILIANKFSEGFPITHPGSIVKVVDKRSGDLILIEVVSCRYEAATGLRYTISSNKFDYCTTTAL